MSKRTPKASDKLFWKRPKTKQKKEIRERDIDKEVEKPKGKKFREVDVLKKVKFKCK